MATVKLLSDEELSPEARAVFDDIRKTRQSDFVNNFWRALAHDPKTLRRTWESIKEVMAPGALRRSRKCSTSRCRLHTDAATASIRTPREPVRRA
jgi:alkylhydroperoxidase family enzyme